MHDFVICVTLFLLLCMLAAGGCCDSCGTGRRDIACELECAVADHGMVGCGVCPGARMHQCTVGPRSVILKVSALLRHCSWPKANCVYC